MEPDGATAEQGRLGLLYRIGLPIVAVVHLGLAVVAAMVSSAGSSGAESSARSDFAFWETAAYCGCSVFVPLILSAGLACLLWLWKRDDFWRGAAKTTFWVLLAFAPLTTLSILVSALQHFSR